MILFVASLQQTPKKDNLSVLISLEDVSGGKLRFESRIKPYRIFTVNQSIVIKKLCSLKKEKFLLVLEKLYSVLK